MMPQDAQHEVGLSGNVWLRQHDVVAHDLDLCTSRLISGVINEVPVVLVTVW